ncbi:MAG: hypothetical protein ACFB10_20185 [Salibacteraceae bacterium]
MEKLRSFEREDGVVYAEVWADYELNGIVDIWKGKFETEDNFQKVIDFACRAFIERNLSCWMADLRTMKGSFDTSIPYLLETIMPKMLANGLQKEAVVLPQDAYAKLSVSTAILAIRDKRLHFFEDPEEARQWLSWSYGSSTG